MPRLVAMIESRLHNMITNLVSKRFVTELQTSSQTAPSSVSRLSTMRSSIYPMETWNDKSQSTALD